MGFPHFVVVSEVMEAVRSDLYCAIVSEGIDLQRSGYQLSGDFAADVVPNAVDDSRSSETRDASVVRSQWL